MSTADSPGFAGLRVATFESRLAGPIAELIAKHGGIPVEAPSLREIALENNPEAFAFAERLIAGRFDVVLFLTGVGTHTSRRRSRPASLANSGSPLWPARRSWSADPNRSSRCANWGSGWTFRHPSRIPGMKC